MFSTLKVLEMTTAIWPSVSNGVLQPIFSTTHGEWYTNRKKGLHSDALVISSLCVDRRLDGRLHLQHLHQSLAQARLPE
jgi:hypothetical protein